LLLPHAKRKIKKSAPITFEESFFLRNGGKKKKLIEAISQFIPVIYPQTTANGVSNDRDWLTANPTFDGISHVDVLD